MKGRLFTRQASTDTRRFKLNHCGYFSDFFSCVEMTGFSLCTLCPLW